uniref:Uncharacterized protein n=1 Tax=Arundo donax TaxID=35708 RepID=A0A0A9BVJ9_ARUDO
MIEYSSESTVRPNLEPFWYSLLPSITLAYAVSVTSTRHAVNGCTLK